MTENYPTGAEPGDISLKKAEKPYRGTLKAAVFLGASDNFMFINGKEILSSV